jgi:NAD(P)-dependent dehydrogenase (short-subunit alcohol dehydrogenase family)
VSGRRVLITGSEGYLGRALRAAFVAQGDEVHGIDLPGTGADHETIFDEEYNWTFPKFYKFDFLICNAKSSDWKYHYLLSANAKKAIVNIGSIYGVLGPDPELYVGTKIEQTPAWYAASKGAMIALTKHQATTLAPVRSNCVCPGGIKRGQSKKFIDRYNKKVPLGRMATEHDVVGPVLFLCSDAASYITGQVLMVDGGLSAW